MTKLTIDQEAMQLDVQVGDRLRTYRKLAGLSQTQLGDAIGVSFQQIQKYERGTNRISVSALILLARTLRCDPAELMTGVRPDLVDADQADVLGRFLALPAAPRIIRALSALDYHGAQVVTEVAEKFAAIDQREADEQ